MTYGVGLWFTLMTHTDKIYSSDKQKKKPRPIFQIFNFPTAIDPLEPLEPLEGIHVEKPDVIEEETQTDDDPAPSSSREKPKLSRRFRRSRSFLAKVPLSKQPSTLQSLSEIAPEITQLTSELTPSGIFDSSSDEGSEDLTGGHDSPNWSTTKSALILLGCTILYSLIAEILIGSVDGFLSSFPISEKFLGLTLFAIAPTVTEFYNAVSFAMSGNIALSLEIGSAYVIQVTLLQIPVLVGFSAIWFRSLDDNGFTLIFPPWDIACIFFSVFLLSYIYIEGKSNYFKGVILLLAYCLLMIAFLFVPV
jgi:Ca2+:H+ antiporter